MTVESFEEVIKDYPKYYDDILDKGAPLASPLFGRCLVIPAIACFAPRPSPLPLRPLAIVA